MLGDLAEPGEAGVFEGGVGGEAAGDVLRRNRNLVCWPFARIPLQPPATGFRFPRPA